MTKHNASEKQEAPERCTEAVVDTGKTGEPGPATEPVELPHPDKRAKHKHVKIDSAELDALKAKAAEAEKYYDQLLRARAEFDNYRKRVTQEKQYAQLDANERLFHKLLGVLDTFELALTSAAKAENTQAVIDGVRMVQTQLQTALNESGLEEIDALGKPFDPNFHEAIQQVESAEHEEGTVVQQIRKGYKFKDRLLRPASVIVSTKPELPASADASAGRPAPKP